TRPLRLAPHEALALIVALRALREVSAPSEREVVDRALKKIESAAGEVSDQASAVELHVDPVDTRVRPIVETRLPHHRQPALTYCTAGADPTTQRVVGPMRLIFSEGHTYFEGWCPRACEVRMFRVDRIRDVSVLDTPADPPQDARVTDLSKGLFQPDDDD